MDGGSGQEAISKCEETLPNMKKQMIFAEGISESVSGKESPAWGGATCLMIGPASWALGASVTETQPSRVSYSSLVVTLAEATYERSRQLRYCRQPKVGVELGAHSRCTRAIDLTGINERALPTNFSSVQKGTNV